MCCIDFLYTSTLGVLDYLELLQDERKFFEVKSYHKELGIVVTSVCVLSLMISFPVWIFQLKNRCKRNSNNDIFNFRRIDGESLQSLGALNGQEGKVKDEDALTDSYATETTGCYCTKEKQPTLSAFSIGKISN